MMNQKLLSICIPVYNRKEVFRHCLYEACEASEEVANEVEIVISDNNSEDDLFSIVEEIKLKFKYINVKYNKNDVNIGLCRNFLKVVEIATGMFCWIVGSDDFIKTDSIKTLLNIIKCNKDLYFICCNYDYIYLNKLKFENGKYIDLHDQLRNESMIYKHKAPTWTGMVDKFDYLIDPKLNNVFLGAVMSGVFRKDVWDKVEQNNVDWDGFNSFESIYPHCYIYAKAFINKKAYYHGESLLTVGEGTREWSTDTGKTIWESSLPLIYYNLFGDLINNYKNYGLEIKQYRKCRRATAFIAGNYFLPIIFRKHIFKKSIKDVESINVMKSLKLYLFIPDFYIGIITSVFSAVKRHLLH
jgi:hypothetical protein